MIPVSDFLVCGQYFELLLLLWHWKGIQPVENLLHFSLKVLFQNSIEVKQVVNQVNHIHLEMLLK